MTVKHRCEARTSVRYGSDFVRCHSNGKVERDGIWYCKRHDPVAKEQYIKDRNAKWQAKWDARDVAKKRQVKIDMAEQAVIAAARRWVHVSPELEKAVDRLEALKKRSA